LYLKQNLSKKDNNMLVGTIFLNICDIVIYNIVNIIILITKNIVRVVKTNR